MNARAPFCQNPHSVRGSLDAAEIDALLDPLRDPARNLPSFAEDTQDAVLRPVDPDLPSVEAIEAALLAHVRDGVYPINFLRALLAPFGEQIDFDLQPGKGKQRPSYAIYCSPFGPLISRRSVREVAEELHHIASQLSRYAVGERARKMAPVFLLEMPGWASPARHLELAADNIATARDAYRSFAHDLPVSINIDLEFSGADIAAHTLAARAIMARQALGEPDIRQKAIDLISAVHDLRAVATVMLRKNPKACKNRTYWIDLPLHPEGRPDIIDDRMDSRSKHDELAFRAAHREMIEGLQAVVRKHEVFRGLPHDWSLELGGEPQYLDAQIKDASKPADSLDRRLPASLFEFQAAPDLAERLSRINGTPEIPDEHWRLTLTGRQRSASSYTLTGATLAHAIARAISEKGSRATMVLTDLTIDLHADNHGETPDVHLYRVLPR